MVCDKSKVKHQQQNVRGLPTLVQILIVAIKGWQPYGNLCVDEY